MKGYGYIVREHYTGLYTVINLTDLNGVYIADHIQLNIKESEYDYKDYKTRFIRFEGISYKYKRGDNSTDYSIDITKPIDFLDDRIYNGNYTERYYDIELNIEKFRKYFYDVECNDLYKLLKTLAQRLNSLTVEYGNSFIYNYLINSFMLYDATYDLYNGELQRNKITDEAIISLILILASLIFQIEINEKLDLYSILLYITEICNLEQNVYCYESMTKLFEKFCKSIGVNSSEKSIKKAWYIVRLRKTNFRDNPNSLKVSKDMLAETAYLVLNDYIN